MSSDGDAEIRTVSGSSRNSELLARSAEALVEPPSTVIELKVEEQICGEQNEHEQRAQVTISNILARAEEEGTNEEVEKATKKNEENDQEAVEGKDTVKDAKGIDEDKSNAGDRINKEANSQKLETDQQGNAEKTSEKDKDQARTADETETRADPGESEGGEAQKKAVVEPHSETLVHGDGEDKDQEEEKKSETQVSPSAELGPDMEVQANMEVSPSTEVVLSTDKGPGVQGSPSEETSSSAEKGPGLQEGPSEEKSPSLQEIPIVQESPVEVCTSKEDEAMTQKGPSAETSPSREEGSSTERVPSSTASPSTQEGPSVPESPGVETDLKHKGVKIARLDVSSVAMDTERLELKENSAAVSPFFILHKRW